MIGVIIGLILGSLIATGAAAYLTRPTATRLSRFLDSLDEPAGDTGYTHRQILRGDNLRDLQASETASRTS